MLNAIRVGLLVGAVVVYGLGAVASNDDTELGADLGPALLLGATLALVLTIGSWWSRRVPVLLIPAAAIEVVGLVAFAAEA